MCFKIIYNKLCQNVQVHAGYFRVSIVHRTDMDYRIFNVRAFLCVRLHTGVAWAHRQRVSTTILTRKNSHKCFLCSGQDSNPRPLDPSLTLYLLSHPVTPFMQLLYYCIHMHCLPRRSALCFPSLFAFHFRCEDKIIYVILSCEITRE